MDDSWKKYKGNFKKEQAEYRSREQGNTLYRTRTRNWGDESLPSEDDGTGGNLGKHNRWNRESRDSRNSEEDTEGQRWKERQAP